MVEKYRLVKLVVVEEELVLKESESNKIKKGYFKLRKYLFSSEKHDKHILFNFQSCSTRFCRLCVHFVTDLVSRRAPPGSFPFVPLHFRGVEGGTRESGLARALRQQPVGRK